MEFVNEIISEEEKRRIDWTQFKWWPSSDPHRPWKWTIDRDRDAFLVMLVGRGRDGDHPEIYAFYWKGDVIRFEAESDGKGMFATGVDMFWKVSNIEIPLHLQKQQEEILIALRAAIDAHGSIYDRENVKSVHVEFL